MSGQGADVAHGIFGRRTDDAVGMVYVDALEREECRLDSCSRSRGELERAACLGSVADDSCKVFQQVFDVME